MKSHLLKDFPKGSLESPEVLFLTLSECVDQGPYRRDNGLVAFAM